MKRKILTIITIGSILCMALTGCGGSSGKRTTSDRATKADAVTTEEAERRGDSEDEKTKEEAEAKTEEESGTKADNPAGRKAGLYQSDGGFIPWDDLGIDVEGNYTSEKYKLAAENPSRVFKDNNYEGHLVLPDESVK